MSRSQGDSPSLQAVLVHRGTRGLAAYGFSDARDGARVLAEAIAGSPAWHGGGSVVVAVRCRPEPLIALVGRFDATQRARIESLRSVLATILPWTRRLGPSEVESACVALAAHLRNELDPSELTRTRFVGVPRGGAIVLGMVSYLLDLEPTQLRLRPTDPSMNGGEAPVVIVDDVVISGLRAAEAIARAPEDTSVVLATLASPPEARQALQRSFPQLRSVLSALDLHDHAPEIHGDELEAWRARWRRRSPEGAVWIGSPEHLVFPWGEPDIASWNEERGRSENAWQLFPPSTTLKARGRREGLSKPSHAEVQEVAASNGRYQLAAHLLQARTAEGVLLVDSENEVTHLLEASSAVSWSALLDVARNDDPIEYTAQRLLEVFDVSSEQARADARTFRDEVLAAGLLCDALA